MKSKKLYLVVGDGRLAKHLRHYLLQEDLPFISWSRRDEARGGPELRQLLEASPRTPTVLLAIRDDALEPFVNANFAGYSGELVHFSGSFSHPKITGLHPLASFHQNFFDNAFYKQILFVSELGRPSFAEVFPDLSNPSVPIPAEQKPFYHALCSLAANLSQFLWSECYENLHSSFGISESELQPFLISTFQNLARNPKALTGPLIRGDFQTVQNHEDALDGHLLQGIYRSFVHTFLRSRHSMEATGENASRFFEV